MTDQELKQKEGKKGFFGRLMEKLDKKVKDASKKSPCCGGSNEHKGSSCC